MCGDGNKPLTWIIELQYWTLTIYAWQWNKWKQAFAEGKKNRCCMCRSRLKLPSGLSFPLLLLMESLKLNLTGASPLHPSVLMKIGNPPWRTFWPVTLLTLSFPACSDKRMHTLTHGASLEKISYRSNLCGSGGLRDINLICHNRSLGNRPHWPDPWPNWRGKGDASQETPYRTRAVPEAN